MTLRFVVLSTDTWRFMCCILLTTNKHFSNFFLQPGDEKQLTYRVGQKSKLLILSEYVNKTAEGRRNVN